MLSVLLALLFCVAREPANSGVVPHGIVAKFTEGAESDCAVLPNLALFVAHTNSPSALLKPGKFTAEFSGFVSVELRAQYSFRVVARGSAELFINGNSVLSFSGTGNSSEPSKPVRLNRGTNAISARFTAPDSGDAQLQVLWTPKNSAIAIPIPTEALSYLETPELNRCIELHRGLNLFAEYRCARCHLGSEPIASQLDFAAPDFEEIGSRLNSDWMAEWILHPSGHMPKLFSDPKDATKIAAYLATLKRTDSVKQAEGDGTKGEELFRVLNCSACHVSGSTALDYVGRKFQTGALVEYLENPQRHYACNPMPNFKLSRAEAADLAAFLNRAKQLEEQKAKGSPEEGQALVQRSGCLNCHPSKLQNRFSAPAISAIAKSPQNGCLNTNGVNRSPRYAFKPGESEALTAFLRNADFQMLRSPPPHELAMRQIETLRCAECHDKIEGAPRVNVLGGKLKPGWAKRFIQGDVPYKPRPWMQQRMPAFPEHASMLATGLAALNGIPPGSDTEHAPNSQFAATGAKLVSAAGGFSCVACHAVGSFTSGQVVETPGVNLAHSGERLLKSYFDRWLMNPVALEPNTKMPVYFDAQGRSQLTDILEGDAQKQIDAIWQYVRLGDKMPAPPIPRP